MYIEEAYEALLREKDNKLEEAWEKIEEKSVEICYLLDLVIELKGRGYRFQVCEELSQKKVDDWNCYMESS